MLESNVVISIWGQECQDGTYSAPIELVTEGVLRQEQDTYVLSYQESEVTGMAGTLTTFQIAPQCVTLLRVGEYNSQMVFEEGRRHMSLYETPYGQLSFGIHTRKMRFAMDDKGGEIEIGYNLEINHRLASTHDFHIRVREKHPGMSIPPNAHNTHMAQTAKSTKSTEAEKE